jgi:hypothetical protein
VRWLGEVEQSLPTLIVAARDPAGGDLLDVRVWLDGRLLAERLDGRPWPVDPGPHVLRFEAARRLPERRQLLLSETEKNRRIDLVLREPGEPAPVVGGANGPRASVGPTPEPSSAPGIHPVAWSSFAVGAAGLVVGVVTGALGWSRMSAIEERCPGGRCSTAEADDYRDAATLARVSTLGFIAAGAGITVGVVSALALAPPGDAGPERAMLEPVLGPGVVGLRGRFP